MERQMALQKKVESFYKLKGMPITTDVLNLVKNSVELGLSDEEVLENLHLRGKKPPAHLVPPSDVLLLRKDGWILARLERLDDDGYVVEWQETDGEWCHKTVAFSASESLKPRSWDPATVGQKIVPATPSPAEDFQMKPFKKIVDFSAPAPPPKPAPEKKDEEKEVKKEEPKEEEPKKEEPEEEPKEVKPEKKSAVVVTPPQPALQEEAAGAATTAPARTTRAPADGDLLIVDGCGTGICDEMQDYLEEDSVQFALVQIPLGSGTFQRNKTIMVQYVGSACPAMKRAKQVQKQGAVAEVFGSTHASITIDGKADCTLEHLLKELKHVFVSDDGTFSAAALKEEILEKIAEAKRQQEEKIETAKKTMAELPMIRPTATSMGVDVNGVMKEIRKPLGALNWALFEASTDLTLHEAGSDSVQEMALHLDDSKVLYGILRLGFGLGSFRRTKWVAVTFVGSEIGPVQRGKLLGCKNEMMTTLKPHQITLEIQGSEMLTLEYVIEKVRPYIVSDSIEHSGAGRAAHLAAPSTALNATMADFEKALLEEKVAGADFFGEDPSQTMANLAAIAPFELEDYDVEETIERVKSNDDPLLWAVFSLANQ